MNLFRTLPGIALFSLSAMGLSSCLTPPDFPITPEIDFKETQVTHIPAGTQDAVDELTFVLNFRDGDGDLGLSKDDILLPPYNQPPRLPVPQRNHTTNEYNYFIQPYLKDPVTGQFTRFTTPPPFGKIGQYDGTYPRLDAINAKPAPLQGELRYLLPISLDGSVYQKGQVFRYEITILDRALHVSNTVTSAEITLGQ